MQNSHVEPIHYIVINNSQTFELEPFVRLSVSTVFKRDVSLTPDEVEPENK